MNPSVPACSVVICTRDRPAELDRCLDAVTRLRYAPFDVLVVDNAPQSKLAKDIAARRGVRYIVEPLPGVARARNCGARACDSEIVAYVDDDAVCEPEWLSSLVDEFRNPQVMAVTGRALPLNASTEGHRQFALRSGYDLGGERRTFDSSNPEWLELSNFGGIGLGMNMALRRALFDVWPGFDERLGRGSSLRGGEENYAYFTLLERGYRIVYTPRAVVRHPFPRDLKELRELHLETLANSAGYFTFLLFEHPRYWASLLRYAGSSLRARPNRRGGQMAEPHPRIVAPLRALLACLFGLLLYGRFLWKEKVCGRRPRMVSKEVREQLASSHE